MTEKITWLLEKKLIDKKNAANLIHSLKNYGKKWLKPQLVAIKLLETFFPKPQIPASDTYLDTSC